jgi:hypothetical protein
LSEQNEQAHESSRGIGAALGLFVVGCFFLFAAYDTWTYQHWPIYIPPQLDVFGLIFGLFGERIGVVMQTTFLGFIGSALTALPVVAITRCSRQEKP